MDALIAQVKALANTDDEADHKKLLETLRGLLYSLETHQDSANRIMYLYMQVAVVRIGCDLQLFDMLVENANPMTIDSLSQKTGAAPTLLGRILRYLASIGCIKETDQDTFTKNNVTEALAIPGFRGGIYHNFDTLGPPIQALPDFLKEHKYQDVSNVLDGPLQKAWNTDLPSFMWIQTKPENFANFNQYMAVQRLGMPTWLDVYPWQAKSKGLKLDQTFFVDLGGGIGHQSLALREKLPELPNKIILQDIPVTLRHAIKHPGIEVVAHDFFQPQVITGARIYYMRNIMHDYPDDKAVIILKNIAAALGPDSVILIDDMIIPNTGAHWEATQLDMTMLTGASAAERTRDQWFALAEKAELKINKIYQYTASLQDSIIECVALR